MIHPSSYLTKKEPIWVLFDELVKTTREFMKNVVEIESAWLLEVAPFYFSLSDLGDGEQLPNLKKLINKD